MTDIMKLADDYAAKNRAVANVIEQGTSGELIEADGDKKRARAALKSAIEALQEENALLEGTLESRGRNIAEMQAENERLKVESTNKNDWLVEQRKWEAHANALQAKLDELRRQEPVEYQSFTKPGFISCSPASWEPCTHEQYQDHFIEGTPVRKLYASPKALAPLTDERIDELAVTALTDYREGRNNDHERAFARAIEAAHGIGGTP